MPEGSGHTAQDKIWKDDQVKWGKECRFVTGKFLNMRAALRSFTNCTTFSEESPPPRPTLEKSSGVGNPEANAELRLPLSLLFKLQFSWRRQGMHLMLWACRIFDMQWTQVGGYLNTQISMSKKNGVWAQLGQVIQGGSGAFMPQLGVMSVQFWHAESSHLFSRYTEKQPCRNMARMQYFYESFTCIIITTYNICSSIIMDG